MIKYEWIEEEKGKEMINNIKELKKKIGELPLTGSLSGGIGKGIANAIESKAKDLDIPGDEAIIMAFENRDDKAKVAVGLILQIGKSKYK